MILADTDVVIDYLNGIDPIERRVRDYIQSDSLQITAVSCFELLSGARKDKRGEKVRSFVAAISVISLDLESAARAAAVRQALDDGGFSIGMADCLIAGIALAHGLALFTRNRKHFERIEKLNLVP